jgi:hypothetical protein
MKHTHPTVLLGWLCYSPPSCSGYALGADLCITPHKGRAGAEARDRYDCHTWRSSRLALIPPRRRRAHRRLPTARRCLQGSARSGRGRRRRHR